MNRNALDGLIAFRTVARRRSFTAAADELGVSPPAVSKIVRQLERRLGAALLIRTTRSTHLTEAGERLLAQAEPALEQLLAAMDDLKSYAQAPAGTLRLNLPRFSYAAYLAPRIASFVGKHPAVTLELYFQDEATDVVADGFDAGIRDADI
ncbi:MAG: LysR family transcriptional regulator, partial [Proteobacteria bacterium]